MGKWSGDHYDDILTTKIKSLVSGAIVRAKLERNEDGSAPPTITYEKFVQELSSGDAFATSLIDALVGEIADRRNRPGDEREFVSQNTAKALRSLSSPHRILRDQTHSIPRRRSSAWRSASRAYLHAPPDEHSAFEPEAEDFETMADAGPASTSLESVRTLHDAYSTWVGSSGLLLPRSRGSASPPLPSFLSDEPILSLPSPPTRTSTLMPASSLPPTSAGTSLMRTASLRRPSRSRTSDFNEFSNTRRAQYRTRTQSEAIAQEATAMAEASELGGPASRSRRFFPLRHHHRHIHTEGDVLPWLPMEDTEQRSDTPPPVEPHVFSTLFAVEDGGDHLYAPSDPRERAISGSARRLRRGGVRAPEYLAVRRDTNAPRMLPSPSASSDNDTRPAGGTGNNVMPQNDESATVDMQPVELVPGLPTPPLFVADP